MNPLKCMTNKSSHYRLIVHFACDCEQNRRLTDTKEYTNLQIHLQKTGVGICSPYITGTEAMRSRVHGFFYALSSLVGGVLGGREACRIQYPVCKPDTSPTAQRFAAPVGGLQLQYWSHYEQPVQQAGCPCTATPQIYHSLSAITLHARQTFAAWRCGMSLLRTLANPFQFIEQDIRTATDENDNIWFCAKDVCSVLDITWNGSTLENMPEKWVTMLKLRTVTGEKNAIFINEPGLYRLIFRSNKPKAIEFSNWICEVVLPELRRNGIFGELDVKAEILLDKRIDELSHQLVTTKNAFRRKLLMDRLRRVCNIAQQPLPAMELLGQNVEQAVLPGFEGKAGGAA
ncbi:BRO-N domain-containing protein [Methylobacter sp.]|uniref:BRO-N domain-containing protein n=1 Tax=Methylobacter sp. TaxID=2051955 RepID=UPI003DA55FDC